MITALKILGVIVTSCLAGFGPAAIAFFFWAWAVHQAPGWETPITVAVALVGGVLTVAAAGLAAILTGMYLFMRDVRDGP